MKVLPIILMSCVFSGVYAGVLPADFHFKSADDTKRTSFISQFKEYQEQQEGAHNPILGQSPQPIEAHDTVKSNEDVQVNFIEKCKKLVAQVITYFTFDK